MKIAIYGYGNVGKGVELATTQNKDVELFGIFTKRDPSSIKTITNAKVYSINDLMNYKNDIDVLIICSGSATELPVITPNMAEHFNVVDSFDTHAKIPEHFKNVNEKAKITNHTALISCGWDPGMFSLMRLYSRAILPNGKDYTFWGRGVSQGHSDAIRHIKGVIDARQYTVPKTDAVEKVKLGFNPDLSTRDKHFRECYVVVEETADKNDIEKQIKNMPNYFSDYDTVVHFISKDEMDKKHNKLPHGGQVLRSGHTGLVNEHKHLIEYNLTLDSNPEFTASALVAFARAVDKMHKRGEVGCFTVFDVRPGDIINMDGDDIRRELL